MKRDIGGQVRMSEKGFQDRYLKPLGHPSESRYQRVGERMQGTKVQTATEMLPNAFCDAFPHCNAESIVNDGGVGTTTNFLPCWRSNCSGNINVPIFDKFEWKMTPSHLRRSMARGVYAIA